MAAITVDKVTKKFKIPHEKRTTMLKNLLGIIRRRLTYEEFLALGDVSFEVERGESFGIIGRNGSGKSTLLKILARVLYPDSGSVTVKGRVAPFLELGVGFQPELSAQENVYLYASVLGMGSKQVDKKYDEIFEFAELKKFESMKLKNFSSGMYLRLAFSTAVQVDPDVLLIDEVLAVGDESFQKKCAVKIDEFKEQGKTIVLVSHGLESVKKICRRSLLLDHGSVIAVDDTEKVIARYIELLEPK
jgi:lipopolysaccharide transport system ATP-binding protein